MRQPWKWLASHRMSYVIEIASWLSIFLFIAIGIAEAISEWWREIPSIRREIRAYVESQKNRKG